MPRLIVFAKEPRPGAVKTRLARSVGDQAAARLYAAFLADTLATCRAVCGTRGGGLCVSYSPARSAGYFGELAPEAVLLPQPDGDLGARLGAAAKTVFDLGARGVVLVGSDLPYLEQADLERALDIVEAGRAVLGPSCDGGYWLLGLPHLAPAVFAGIDWSTPRVLAQTEERLGREGLTVERLATHFDVDDEEDLTRLRALLESAATERCSHTRAVLSRLDC